jgi:aryl-alcohol dehydrogenase-like predicted oxidoreductase
VSSLGLGTYLGEDDEATDVRYAEAIAQAIGLGCNVLDTAINYRNQRSERAIGRTLSKLVTNGKVSRDEIVVATKGGFIPFDSGFRGGMREYVEETFIRPGIIKPADIVAGCHCMTPRYLRHQLEMSLQNLRLAAVDIYYVHNPETQLEEVSRPVFERRIRGAFEVLEEAVAEGKAGIYGTATWNGYRIPPTEPGYLSLADLARCAMEVAGENHHFRALQLPFNLAMTEAFTVPNQPVGTEQRPTLRAAAEMGFTVMASASLLQARLTANLPDRLRAQVDGGLENDAQRALQFVRSAPGVTTALVGMSNPAHVKENLGLAAVAPLPETRFSYH